MLVYCDTVILIYFLEQTGVLQSKTTARLAAIRAAGDELAASDLTRLECRVGPIKRNDALLLARYDALFSKSDVRLVPLTGSVYDRAAEIRARNPFKLADAIHLAAAVEAGCGLFLTNDRKLTQFTDISVEVL
jgi:predicted nucleic acid-binding protein